MTAIVYQIRDFYLKRLERDGKEILSQAIDYRELAKLGGPIIQGSVPCDMPSYMDRDPA